jgi:hypothetical protein
MILVFSTFAAPNTTGYETCIVKCRIENPKEEWRQEDNEPKKKKTRSKKGKRKNNHCDFVIRKRAHEKKRPEKTKTDERKEPIHLFHAKEKSYHPCIHAFIP